LRRAADSLDQAGSTLVTLLTVENIQVELILVSSMLRYHNASFAARTRTSGVSAVLSVYPISIQEKYPKPKLE
jgi:hypothetical protein